MSYERYVVAAGTSLTVTRGYYLSPAGAKGEVVRRLRPNASRALVEQLCERVTARPATDDDLDWFDGLVRESSSAYRKEAKVLLRQMRKAA